MNHRLAPIAGALMLFAAAAAAPIAQAKDPAKPAPAAATAAARLPAGVERVTNVEGITEYRLQNGLKVLLFPDPSKPTVTVNITYLVGSRHENYGETGMAHLLEHLVFKGTPKIPHLDKEFNKRGMRPNGTTWLDRTNYYELFQASDDNLKWAIEMEADRMVNAFIAKKDLDSEMTVVRNEYERGENAPFQVLMKRMQSVAFDWHNYGNSTIGNRSDIENVDISNLQAFYRRYYQPDNAVLLIAGKFDEAKALGWVADAFGKIAKPKRVLPKLWTVEPTQDGERSFMVRRKGEIQIVALAYKVPSALHGDSDAVSFVNFVLTDTPSGRLHKALVEKGKAAQVVGFPLQGLDMSLHLIGAVVKKGEPVEPVKEELVRIVEEFHKNPPTKEELERAKKNFANQFEKTLNNHESIGLELSESIALGDWRLFFQSRDQAEQVTSEQVAKAAQAYYRRDNRIVGMFLPEDAPQRADIPAPPKVAEAMASFKPKVATVQAEAFDPSTVNIDKRTKIVKVGDLKVALLAKKNRGETVNVTLRLHAGDEKSLFGKAATATLAGGMLSRGSTKYTRTQIADEFDKLKVSGGVGGLNTSMQTTGPNVAAAIRLAAHVLREPAFPESEFEQMKKQILTNIEAQKSEPGPRANEAMGIHFNQYQKGDWRYAGTLDELAEAFRSATLDDVKRFHAEFYGAAQGEVAIVGDFNEAEVTKALQESFAGWKAAKFYQRIASDFKDVAPANRTVETPDKENGVFSARLNVNLRDDDPEYPAMYMANYMFGGGAGMNSRLMERIRQKDGLSYGIGSQLAVGSQDRAGFWAVQGTAAPQNIAKVEAAFKEELARMLKDGFPQAELAVAKSGVRQMLLQSRAQDGTLAGGWAGNLFLGRTFTWQGQFEEKILALKPEDITAAVRKHIDPEKLTIVKALDVKKAAAAK
ncbi:MAG: insulinase family protein [Betaproteobacteria bacterium]|nr:insulinase family protein [Betaproteobacteria bacterium]